jgi:hypothetical protein
MNLSDKTKAKKCERLVNPDVGLGNCIISHRNMITCSRRGNSYILRNIHIYVINSLNHRLRRA